MSDFVQSSHKPFQKLAGLDHLRAFAITIVLFFHYRLFNHPDWVQDVFSSFGWTGVDLFFVLSGYLISSQLFARMAKGRGIGIKEFYFKRFFRIMPAYLVVLALYFLVPPFKEWEALPPLWKFLSFTQNIGLERLYFGTFSHAWSLCIEEQFYLVLPFAIALAISIKIGKKAFWVLAALFVAGFIYRLAAWQHIEVYMLQDPQAFRHKYFMMWIYYPTPSRLDGLLVGVCIAMIFQYLPNVAARIKANSRMVFAIGMALLTAAYFVCAQFASFSTAIFGYPLLAIAYGVVLMAAISPNHFLYKTRSRITSFIAALSYSLYLSHKGVIHLTQVFFESKGVDPNGNLMLLLSMANCIAAAMLLHYGVEKPFLRLRDNILQKRKQRRTDLQPVAVLDVVQ